MTTTPSVSVFCGRCGGEMPISNVKMVFGPPDAPHAVMGFDAAMHYLRWQLPPDVAMGRETAMLGGWETR